MDNIDTQFLGALAKVSFNPVHEHIYQLLSEFCCLVALHFSYRILTFLFLQARPRPTVKMDKLSVVGSLPDERWEASDYILTGPFFQALHIVSSCLPHMLYIVNHTRHLTQ